MQIEALLTWFPYAADAAVGSHTNFLYISWNDINSLARTYIIRAKVKYEHILLKYEHILVKIILLTRNTPIDHVNEFSLLQAPQILGK